MNNTHNISNNFQIFFKYTCKWNILISNTQNQSLIHVYIYNDSGVRLLCYHLYLWVPLFVGSAILLGHNCVGNNLLHYILRWFYYTSLDVNTWVWITHESHKYFHTNNDDYTKPFFWCRSSICNQVCLVKIIGLYFISLYLAYFSTCVQILVMFFDLRFSTQTCSQDHLGINKFFYVYAFSRKELIDHLYFHFFVLS